MTSKIKVDNIENQCGGAVVTKCGGTTTISGTVVKSNTLQASDAGNIISQSGTTITLGATGDNIVLAGGATQSGFGRTGTVDWQTGSIKTATFTAANGEGYFADTSGGAFTMNLPAGVAGNIVSVVDYTNTFQTNNLTIAPNGSEKIGGIAASIALSTEGQSVTFVYVDATEGWKNVQDSTSNVTGNPFLQASVTGACNTLTTVGDCKVATFTGPGNFVVSSLSQTAPHNVVSYMVVAGGGGQRGSGHYNGGGGAGGFREIKTPNTSYTASPLDGYSTPANRVTVTVASFPIAVGGGGGANGSNSSFGPITSTGGGGGGSPGNGPGNTGGSGGGGSPFTPAGVQPGGAGNTPPVSPSQGNPGGIGNVSSPFGGAASGGGGGAGAVGGNSNTSNPITAGTGGAGVATSISGSSVTRAGGGGGAAYSGTGGPGGSGGGGTGGNYPNSPASSSGVVNTGGGGGGDAGFTSPTGGSGIVIIRYKFQ
jgi:hypothetical protein